MAGDTQRGEGVNRAPGQNAAQPVQGRRRPRALRYAGLASARGAARLSARGAERGAGARAGHVGRGRNGQRCLRRGVAGVEDLAGRVLSEADYARKWMGWCDAVHEVLSIQRSL